MTLLTAIICFSLLQMQLLEESSDALAKGSLRKALLAHACQNAAQAQATQLHSLFLLDARAARVAVYAEIDRNNLNLTKALASLTEVASDDQEQTQLRQVIAARESFAQALNDTVDAVELDTADAKRLMLRDTMPALEMLLRAADALVALQVHRVETQTAVIRATETQSKRLLVMLGLAAVLAGGLSAWAITRSVARPLAEAVRFADAIAAGRLDAPLPDAGGDEIGTLIGALERMRGGVASARNGLPR